MSQNMLFFFKCAAFSYCGFCHVTMSCHLSVLRSDISSTVQRIVGQNSQKSMLVPYYNMELLLVFLVYCICQTIDGDIFFLYPDSMVVWVL